MQSLASRFVAAIVAVLALMFPLAAATPTASAGTDVETCSADASALDQSAIPSLPSNEVYATFNLSRAAGADNPGSWSITIDWGDGTTTGPYTTPPDTTAAGARAADAIAFSDPPKQAVVSHTYKSPGNYDVAFKTSGTVTDASGATTSCGGTDNDAVAVTAPEPTPTAAAEPATLGPSDFPMRTSATAIAGVTLPAGLPPASSANDDDGTDWFPLIGSIGIVIAALAAVILIRVRAARR